MAEAQTQQKDNGRTRYSDRDSSNTATDATGFRKIIRMLVVRSFGLFLPLCILTIPFPMEYLPDPGSMLRPVTEPLTQWFGGMVLGLGSSFSSPILSDTTGLYVHLLLLSILSLVTALSWVLAERRFNLRHCSESVVVSYLSRFAAYVLALSLFDYGFNKVFKWQFYLPEPNTLFATVGDTPRDLLYWTVMGASRPYTMFMGGMEVLAAVLLLFRRTRMLGGMLAFGIMVNVVAVNFSFDISVKVYSSILLLLSLALLLPERKRLLRLVSGGQSETAVSTLPAGIHGTSEILPHRRYVILKSLAIGTILFGTLAPYAARSNFNDDTADRPPFHGAYRVNPIGSEADSHMMDGGTRKRAPYRLFVHRRGYLIIDYGQGQMEDYRMRIDTVTGTGVLVNPRSGEQTAIRIVRDGSGRAARLECVIDGERRNIGLSPIDLTDLQLLKNEFHWTID